MSDDAPQQLFLIESDTDYSLDGATSASAIVVFTDGACIGNPGPGGWGWAVGKERYASGAEPQTTNQRMELSAVISALASISGEVEVVSDSMYVVNCFKDRWWQGWRRRNWKNAKGEPVKNRDLWEALIEEVIDHRGESSVHFRWVKGHAGDPMNEFVDDLATTAARTQQGVRFP
jgi:ribonuclease HI